MEKKRINIVICGRNYPLHINPNEEAGLRKVGKSINDMIKQYEANFDIKDKQDALAMCALKLGANAEQHKHTAHEQDQFFNQQISGLIEACQHQPQAQ
jgi:cell division protein ZapA (FtsZ GTPase activity inhibitor)